VAGCFGTDAPQMVALPVPSRRATALDAALEKPVAAD
jgi:hypothetical protein